MLLDIHPEVRLQRVILDRPASLRDLYWRIHGDARLEDNGTLRIESGACAAFDTYFNAFFEYHWRLHTRVASIIFRAEIEGRAKLQLWRMTQHGGQTLLHESEVDGAAEVHLPNDTPNFRQAGMMWFELTAKTSPVVLRRAEWYAADRVPDPVGLAVVICTFNREADVAGALATIAGDAALCSPGGSVVRVFVVSQGRAGLLRHPDVVASAARLGDKLRVIEQGNFGGAGGFGRGLLEALDDDEVTHVAFLDDDVRIEPESLLRMAAYFSLAQRQFCLGGHMLDSVCPTNLYEGGAVVQDNWVPRALNHQLDLRSRTVLSDLTLTQATHYSGWWFFGFPKELAREHGMPLPCFIRGDDIEWGMRLYGRGVPTVPLPGVAIWHEPFYLKGHGWQLYYETRNALICAALHMNFTPGHAARQILWQVMTHLLTYRYYSAALIVKAVEDFLRGPEILDADPRTLHAAVGKLRSQYPEETVSRDVVLWNAPVARTPHSRVRTAVALGGTLWRNFKTPSSPTARPRLLLLRELIWFRITGSDALAIETHWEREMPLFRRDRAHFRALTRDAVRAVQALYSGATRLRAAWKHEAPRLTSLPHWRAYLGLGR